MKHQASDPADLEAEAARFLGCALKAAAASGPTLKVTKTRITHVLHGPGHQRRKAVFLTRCGTRLVVEGMDVALEAVRQTRPLGTVLADGGSAGVEIASRTGVGSSSRPLRHEVHARKQLDVCRAVQIRCHRALPAPLLRGVVGRPGRGRRGMAEQAVPRSVLEAIGWSWKRREQGRATNLMIVDQTAGQPCLARCGWN